MIHTKNENTRNMTHKKYSHFGVKTKLTISFNETSYIPGDPSQTDTFDLALMQIIIIFEQCLIVIFS